MNYIASKMGLIGNSIFSSEKSTNKYLMRKCFMENGDPSPKSIRVNSKKDPKIKNVDSRSLKQIIDSLEIRLVNNFDKIYNDLFNKQNEEVVKE